jgi:hypothetical protein
VEVVDKTAYKQWLGISDTLMFRIVDIVTLFGEAVAVFVRKGNLRIPVAHRTSLVRTQDYAFGIITVFTAIQKRFDSQGLKTQGFSPPPKRRQYDIIVQNKNTTKTVLLYITSYIH